MRYTAELTLKRQIDTIDGSPGIQLTLTNNTSSTIPASHLSIYVPGDELVPAGTNALIYDRDIAAMPKNTAGTFGDPSGTRIVTFEDVMSAADFAALSATLDVKRAVPVRVQVGSEFVTCNLRIVKVLEHPTIDSITMERYPDDEGQEISASVKLSVTSPVDLSGYALITKYNDGWHKTNTTATYESTDGEEWDWVSDITLADLIGGVTDDLDVFKRSDGWNNGTTYDFEITFGDDVESDSTTMSVSNTFANVHLSGAPGGGVCFGGFSTSSGNFGKFECHYPYYPFGGIVGQTFNALYDYETATAGRWARTDKVGIWDVDDTHMGTVYTTTIYDTRGHTFGSSAGNYDVANTNDTSIFPIPPDMIVDLSGGIISNNGQMSALQWRYSDSQWLNTYINPQGNVRIRGQGTDIAAVLMRVTYWINEADWDE